MKIGFATSDWALKAPDANNVPTLGGAGHYRVGLPSAGLELHGVPVVVGTLAEKDGVLGVMTWPGNDNDRQIHLDCDLVVLQRYMNHDLPAAIRRARANGQIVINDIDDWFFGLPPSNNAFRASHPRFDEESNVNHYRKVLAASSALTASTPFLAQKMEEMFRLPTILVRNAIDAERFSRPRLVQHSPPTVGWVGGQAWRSGDLETLRGTVGPWCLRNGWGFHHSGESGASQASVAELAGVPSEVKTSTSGMCSILKYPALFEKIDLGIVPLRLCPFNEAKSAIKGMEYAAAGVPFIAAAAPEYQWLAGHHRVGRTVKRPKDWLKALDVLSDPGTRAVEVARNRAGIESLNIAVRWIDWYDAYRDISSLAAAA